MIVEPTFALAADVDGELCIADPMATDRTLCGRWRHFLPGVPELPVHEVCKRQWRRIVRGAAEQSRRVAA